MATADTHQRDAAFGIPGLDDILAGGLERGRVYLLEGAPGTGKTTSAMRFLLEGARLGERGLYITLSETEEELRGTAQNHGWSLEGVDIFELVPPENRQGASTYLTVAQHGLVGEMKAPIDVTYLADTVILLRYFEARGEVRRAVSVIKKRAGQHETTIREFTIGSDGLTLGAPLNDFQGVLRGVPNFVGPGAGLMGDPSA